MTDLRLTWDWPETDLKSAWSHPEESDAKRWRIRAQDKLGPNKRTNGRTLWLFELLDRAKKGEFTSVWLLVTFQPTGGLPDVVHLIIYPSSAFGSPFEATIGSPLKKLDFYFNTLWSSCQWTSDKSRVSFKKFRKFPLQWAQEHIDFVKKWLRKTRLKKPTPLKKKKNAKISAYLLKVLYCILHCIDFYKSPQNLRCILYQMDHVWWVPSRLKKSPGVKLRSQLRLRHTLFHLSVATL